MYTTAAAIDTLPANVLLGRRIRTDITLVNIVDQVSWSRIDGRSKVDMNANSLQSGGRSTLWA